MKEQILGSWLLDRFELEDGETRERRPWGAGAHGLLIYAATGHMSVSINKPVVRDETQSEMDDLFDAVLFYAGTYAVSGSTITHQVTEATKPDRVGKQMIRYAKLEGDLLELVTPQEDWGRAFLIWRKVR